MPHPISTPRLSLALVIAALPFSMGPSCGPLKTVDLSAPSDGQLLIASAPVAVNGRVGQVFDPLTVALEVDGVDLVAALGLVAPFADASGSVLVGPDLVTVESFTFDPTLPGVPRITAELSGLPAGAHALALSALKKSDGAFGGDAHAFHLVAGFTLELPAVPSAGLASGPVPTDGSGSLANQSLGVAIAAPPIPTPGGGSLRSGHVEAAEARIAGGGN